MLLRCSSRSRNTSSSWQAHPKREFLCSPQERRRRTDRLSTPRSYLDVLRNISASRIPRVTLKAMSNARVLLCHRRIRLKSAPGSLEEDDYENVYELAFPNEVSFGVSSVACKPVRSLTWWPLQIVILDEPVSSQLFVDELLAAPEESALEEYV